MTPDPVLPVFTKNARFWWLLPALLWGALIFVIISMPPDHIPHTPLLRLPHADKAVHFIMFALFGGLLLLGLNKWLGGGQAETRHILMALLAGVLYSVLTEYYQYCCLPERHGTIPDIIANIFGTIFGTVLMGMTLKTKLKKYLGQK